MKTAISVPDATFEQASKRAVQLGVSRSEFFSRAVARYIDELERESVTEQINAVIASGLPEDDSTSAAVTAGQRLLAESDDEW